MPAPSCYKYDNTVDRLELPYRIEDRSGLVPMSGNGAYAALCRAGKFVSVSPWGHVVTTSVVVPAAKAT